MKKLFFAIAITAGLTSAAFAQTSVATPASAPAAVSTSKAVITYAVDKHEFGTVPQGTPVSYVFSFKNTGKEPLVLSSVTASCGCTTPEWPKEPVAPGATGSIKVTYNAANPGDFTKTVTVVSNAAAPTTVLTIHGDVKPAAAAANTATPAPAPKTAAAPKKS